MPASFPLVVPSRSRWSALGPALLALVLLASACASAAGPVIVEDASIGGQRIPTVAPETTGTTADAASADATPTNGAVPTLEPLEDPASTAAVQSPVTAAEVVAVRRVVNVLNEFPHHKDSFTQGLLLDSQGRMFESTGSYGASATRLIEVDRLTGDPVRESESTSEVWGEGLALIDDRFVQLTYRAKVAFIWDEATFEKIGEFRYDTAGWGLCFDDTQQRLVMSDGTNALVFRDPDTFAPIGTPLPVFLDGVPLKNINELECVNGRIWANVFLSDIIVEIDPANGAVVTVVDASALNQPRPFDANAVLNGIAYDPVSDTFLVTGKFWDTLYEVEFVTP